MIDRAGLGALYRVLGDHERADLQLRQAVANPDVSSRPGPAALGRGADADHHWHTALTVYRELGMPQSAELATRLTTPRRAS